MSDLVKREFEVLALNGLNYLSWSLDAQIILNGKDLLKPIIPQKDVAITSVEQTEALHFMRHHLSATLKSELITKRDPKVLWDLLKTKFEQIETVLLSKVEHK